MKLTPGMLSHKVPERLLHQLRAFQKRVWSLQMGEAVLVALFVGIGSFVLVCGLERLFETGSTLRLSLLILGVSGITIYVPWAFVKWVVGHRKPEDLAKLLAKKDPGFGDRLLGVIELAQDPKAQGRSQELCEAAIRQVDEDAKGREFAHAAPTPKLKRWGALAAWSAAVLLLGVVMIPWAISNSFQRWIQPFGDIPRLTFAQVDNLPPSMIVPAGEAFRFEVALSSETRWSPEQASVRIADSEPVHASLFENHYQFDLPPRLNAEILDLRVGDLRAEVEINPTARPTATSIRADVTLPPYLQRPEVESNEIRSGGLTVVEGSDVSLAVTMSRDLKTALVDGEDVSVDGPIVHRRFEDLEGPLSMELSWVDSLGLSGAKPLSVSVRTREDAPPSIACEGIAREFVLLETETLSFSISAQDDFGVKEIGMTWEGYGHPELGHEKAIGERLIAEGGPDSQSLEVEGAFGGRWLEIKPQVLELQVYVEDFFPDRGRIYSPKYTVFLLSPDEHKRWLTEQLSLWHKQALEVRDRELQLYENNKEIRALTADQLDQADVRQRIERQALAEKANGTRLEKLSDAGAQLVTEAVKNDEFGVGTLEKWAEMLQVLDDIAENRMPSVADLLKEASRAAPSDSKPQEGEGGKAKEAGPSVAHNESDQSAKSDKSSDEEDKKPPTPVPSISDIESRFGGDEEDTSEKPPSPPSTPRFTLPNTTIQGGGPKTDGSQSCPAGAKVDEAVVEQEDLLAEFEKIADELEQILRDLENSTFVKRLKAQARLQRNVADDLSETANSSFGLARHQMEDQRRDILSDASKRQVLCSEKLALIQEDMRAFQERRKEVKYQKVLDEMEDARVVATIEKLSTELKDLDGLGVVHSAFWSDTLDRWAEELVGPG